MALINCPECGKEISDTANNCIHCGYILKRESVTPPQTIVNVEAPKKRKSSSKYLISGITLFLCVLFLSFFGTMTGDELTVQNDAFFSFLVNISKVAAIISFVYSLVLLAVPKLRKTLFVISYFVINLVSMFYVIDSIGYNVCSGIMFVPQLIASLVSCVLIFISLFIKDEKQ